MYALLDNNNIYGYMALIWTTLYMDSYTGCHMDAAYISALGAIWVPAYHRFLPGSYGSLGGVCPH